MEPARAQDAATGPPPRPDDRVRVAGWVDQVVRREAFEAAHPGVKIQAHTPGQPWTALVPMPDGSEVTVTDPGELGGLLDELESLVAAQGAFGQSGGGW
jgi:hypothetical protein